MQASPVLTLVTIGVPRLMVFVSLGVPLVSVKRP